MEHNLQTEAKEDEEVYEKISCWCTTNDKDKTEAIAAAQSKILALDAAIEEYSADSARLSSEIKNLAAEIAANEEALDKATSLRTKELAEFNTEEKDLLGSIGGLKSALTVLGKHQALVQVPEMTLMEAFATLGSVLAKKNTDGVVTPSQRKAVEAFVQQAPGMGESYSSQSGQIFGILNQMKETFETNLKTAKDEEAASVEAYEELKAAKLQEIKSGKSLSDNKQQELADTDEANAQAKQDLENTQAALGADQKFLANLKETCATTDSEYSARKTARAEEVVAVSEALKILSSDDARDQFTTSFNFMQKSQDSKRTEAAKVLKTAAAALHSPRLAQLAVKTRLDAFTKVIGNIDEMVAALTKEKADDVKHKDFCNSEIRENEKNQALKARDIEEHTAKLGNLGSSIEQLTKSIETLSAEVAEMKKQKQRAGEDREIENQDFQKTVADQRASQGLLKDALKVLEGVYKKKDEGYPALLQGKKQEPPAGFKEYKKQGGAGGVLGMLEQIIGEANALEAEAIRDEADAQKAYEAFVKDTNTAVEAKTRAITDQDGEKATAEADHVSTTEDLAAAEQEQKQNQKENADLHSSCDFTLQNFEVRQAALTQEMEALGQAKSILKGSKFTAFLAKTK